MQKNLFQLHQRPVNGERIRQARELNGLTQDTLADAVGIDQTMVAHIERGSKQPGPAVLEALAAELDFPVAYFFQDAPPHFPKGSLLFRAKAGVGKRVVAQVHAHAQLNFEIAIKLSESVSLVPVRLSLSSDPIEGARQIRAAMRLPPGPLLSIIRLVERLGVLVIPLPNLHGCEAFAVWAGPSNAYPVMGLGFGRSPDRVRMSAAHELGHLALHRHFSSGTQDMEVQAYRFGAELLMPASDIVDDLQSERLNLFRLAALKQKWNVSMQALSRRARDLQVISDRQYTYLMRQISARGWRTAEPTWGQPAVEKPRALRKMIEIAFGTTINHRRVAADLQLNESFVSCLLDASAAGPEASLRKKSKRRGRVLPFDNTLKS